ncbi:MAG: hypothetical protein HQL50_13725, partial [Magnetococcales bacterium]|nr:hypothetical protein [Magnetococcales bacterium]
MLLRILSAAVLIPLMLLILIKGTTFHFTILSIIVAVGMSSEWQSLAGGREWGFLFVIALGHIGAALSVFMNAPFAVLWITGLTLLALQLLALRNYSPENPRLNRLFLEIGGFVLI